MQQELQEEFVRVLTVHNTRIPDSLVEWSWKLREFTRLPPPPHLVTLLDVTGTILHKDSEEAKVQLIGGTISKVALLTAIINIYIIYVNNYITIM